MTVDFKYKIDQKVKTCFDDIGIIEMAALDGNNEKTYFVKRADQSQWFKESQLDAVYKI